MIPYGRQWIDASDIRAVVRVLKSRRLTQGPEVERFEEAFAKYCGAPYAVAVSSGTAGLHLANVALGVRPGDEVITSPLSFVATANGTLYCGGEPRFADIDAVSMGLENEKVKPLISKKTRGISSVHFGGQPCGIGSKSEYSSRADFFILEDACHALGAEENIGGRWTKIGACRHSTAAVFSFHPVKHITTGEGGMITTRSKDLYEKLKLLRSHGIEKTKDRFAVKRESQNPWYYEMQTLGFNYRLTDFQCALGLSQLKKMDGFLKKRRAIAEFYNKRFRTIRTLKTPAEIPGRRSSYHLYALRIDFDALKVSRSEVMRFFKKNGVGTQVHYIPVPEQPYYQKRFGFKRGDFPVCEAYYREALSIPNYPAMRLTDARKVASLIEKIFLRKGI